MGQRYYLQANSRAVRTEANTQRVRDAVRSILSDYPDMVSATTATSTGMMVDYDNPFECSAALAACLAANGAVPGAFTEAAMDTLRTRIAQLL